MDILHLLKDTTKIVDKDDICRRTGFPSANQYFLQSPFFANQGNDSDSGREMSEVICEGGFERVCIAIGVFDGVHLGHQQIIKQLLRDSRKFNSASIVITFDRHPKAVIPHAKPPPLIYPLSQKLRVIASYGVRYTMLIPFEQEFSRINADFFITTLHRKLGNLYSVTVGRNFLFGHNRTGNVALLNEYGKRLGFVVNAIEPISLGGKVISSTRIRTAISSGDIELASRMLGRDYSIVGYVKEGDKIGRKIGFPTANLDVTGLVLPPCGVYAVNVVVSGILYKGIANIGYRPTIARPLPQLQFEVHIFDFDKDIYHQEIEVILLRKIREEKQFRSLTELSEQIVEDIKEAKKFLQLS